MKRDERYAKWLLIADELEAFHHFLYDKGGYWHQPNGGHQNDEFLRTSDWLRRRCAKGWWYWWDRGWLGGGAAEPLAIIYRNANDSEPEGKEVIARADALRLRIQKLSKGLP